MIPKVYILDDDITYAKLLAANLGKSGRFRNEIFDSYQALSNRRAEEPPDAIITDLVMPGLSGIEVTRRLRQSDPHLPIFVLTAHADLESAIEALKAGANEYLTKPVNMDELTTLLNRALEERPLREEAATIQKVRQEEFSLRAILGEHPRIEEIRQFVRRIAEIPRPTVLLLGASGTGKNLVARTIHYSSPHSDGRFVEINCSALPSNLLEAELFGYQKGAFTDARESKRGLIEVADAGTLFLDEIGDLSLELQAKLLNFLESRRFRRLGGTEEIEVSQRVITATNRDLEALVRSGEFRTDLYYRISVATHELPPLREVKSDIPLLADHFREVFNAEFRKQVESLDDDTLETLKAWDWPGNVRELRNVIERAMIFADGPTLKPSDLPELGSLEVTAAGDTGEADSFRLPRGLTLADAQREYIRRTLQDCDGSIQRAAETLGISRKNLWEKRKKYGLLQED
ncbi:MAG: sigma-54-dependent Fis family transcriptional regulator [Gemmatimonadetes bacterium]|uniref:Sigma-54-dependent Fis family transcriptional regulator n=1 Tax=Candidatus Kutchimonas denitrificans TaxID=3056748 RepID=A0AAE5CCZ2_9BACT|nr:sigma-54-dependent Fis family transcriptional regulator [Gemmatimonadota bacterium]NIR76320.1 sigma-54-dependent Fis family transcriptional regulator [Candidatus Kutchimonas denitrificans]NIS02343.1 sigma-54-dependent Fis family transcriptional regulator [Gemmatimonadota bacterium]NIT68162.1 sigma-54-dependent Fis family transcriptional regulator [Gemmatimonadota bacterium]NIU54386.1 response regulator [Gemmatimonadota bacterium]